VYRGFRIGGQERRLRHHRSVRSLRWAAAGSATMVVVGRLFVVADGASMVEGFRRWARPGSTTPVARRPTRLRPPGNHRCRHAPGIIGATRKSARHADRIDPDAARFGVGFRSTPTRCAWRQFNRVISRMSFSPRSPDGHGRALRPPGNHRCRHAPGSVDAPREPPLARTAPSLDAFRFGVRSPITLRTLFNDHDTDIGL
jgi:hypothetical protein